MNEKIGNTVALPGKTVTVDSSGPSSLVNTSNVTCGAVSVEFKKIKHLLSDKPLRVPRRPERRGG